MVGCYLLLSRTDFGLQMRGTLENPSLARASGISTHPAVRHDLCLRVGARRPCRRADRAAVQPLRRYRHRASWSRAFVAVMLGGVGTFDGPVLGAGADRHAQRRAALGHGARAWPTSSSSFSPLFVKFRPQGLIAGKEVLVHVVERYVQLSAAAASWRKLALRRPAGSRPALGGWLISAPNWAQCGRSSDQDRHRHRPHRRRSRYAGNADANVAQDGDQGDQRRRRPARPSARALSSRTPPPNERSPSATSAS